jgi:hypothetical protein
VANLADSPGPMAEVAGSGGKAAPTAEVIGSGQSPRASSSTLATSVSPCFFLLPQMRQASAPPLVLLTCACGPCSTRPIEDVSICFFQGRTEPGS